MERATALKKLTRLLGKKLAYRVSAKAPTREEREAAKAELPQAAAEHNRLKGLRDARHKAILEADAEYQSLVTATREAHERSENLRSIMRYYKITVGLDEGWCFLHKAEGDSWEEVIEKIEKKAA